MNNFHLYIKCHKQFCGFAWFRLKRLWLWGISVPQTCASLTHAVLSSRKAKSISHIYYRPLATFNFFFFFFFGKLSLIRVWQIVTAVSRCVSKYSPTWHWAHSHQTSGLVLCQSINVPPPQTPASLHLLCPSPKHASAWLPPLNTSPRPNTHTHTRTHCFMSLQSVVLRAAAAKWGISQRVWLSSYRICGCWVILFIAAID